MLSLSNTARTAKRPAIALLWSVSLLSSVQHAAAMDPIRVSVTNRFLKQSLGAPFALNGDTAWWIHKISRSDVSFYLQDRRNRGFNLIQVVVVVDNPNGGWHANSEGQQPFVNSSDPTAFNEVYFQFFDHVVNDAAAKNLYVMLTPLWAQGANRFSPPQLNAFGNKIASRYRNKANVLWYVGGEMAGESISDRVKALGMGIEAGHGGTQLISVHPSGMRSSSAGSNIGSVGGSYAYHSEGWLDFNTIQSGQEAATHAWSLVDSDYGRSPIKPTFNGEAWYEAVDGCAPLDCRKAAYWSVFAGGFGHTYGSHGIWDFAGNWRDLLNREGTNDMKHLKELVLSRPFFSRIPDQGILNSSSGSTYADKIRATRDSSGKYVFVYIPQSGKTVTINMNKVAGGTVKCWWYNPRDGSSTVIGEYANTGTRAFTTAASGPDWVLVLDDKTQKYPSPGVAPIGFWKFETVVNSQTRDEPGTGATGTLLNGASILSGRIGKALNFDGANDYIDVGNIPDLRLTGAMTLAAWVYIDSTGQPGRIVSKQGASGNRGWSLNLETNGIASFQIATSSTAGLSVNSPSPIAKNQWVHLAGVFHPGSALRLYVNGSEVASNVIGIPGSQHDSSLNVNIGRRPDNTSFFDGRIDEVQIFARALGASDVAALALR